MRLVDKFGDNGMISVIVCRPTEPATWEIDTWLMSCRVLGRKVEAMVLREILAQARQAGVALVIGRYRPSDRNALVKDHYEKLGFTRLTDTGADADGATLWEIDADTAIAAAPMTIRRGGI